MKLHIYYFAKNKLIFLTISDNYILRFMWLASSKIPNKSWQVYRKEYRLFLVKINLHVRKIKTSGMIYLVGLYKKEKILEKQKRDQKLNIKMLCFKYMQLWYFINTQKVKSTMQNLKCYLNNCWFQNRFKILVLLSKLYKILIRSDSQVLTL